MRKRKERKFSFRSEMRANKTPTSTCRIEVSSDFTMLLSAATQTKPEKTISDLYFHFLGEYRKSNPQSILFKRHFNEETIKESHRNFTFIYKVFGYNVKITAGILVTKGYKLSRAQSETDTYNLTVVFTQGDSKGYSKHYKKTFDIKYLEDKMFSEQLFG